jgi:hypothetical protein
VLPISNQDRLDNLYSLLLPQPRKRSSSTNRPQLMVSSFIAVLSSWKTERLKRKSTLTLNRSGLLTNSSTSVVVSSKLNHSLACSKMTKNSDSLLLMVMELYMLLFKVTTESYYKRSLSSCLRSIEKVVSHQSVLLD